jgi:hypothetical protein
MSPTTTAGLPPVIAWACGVWICRMSHWSDENVSASVAGAFGRSPSWASELVSVTGLTRDPNPAVDETPSTLLSRPIAVANDALSERAITTPIWSYA